ncbi:unnamed protein product [Adineta steineri]|uniref:Uncharacterized protein n=1 Tax=Adineta steineri TaxID=433720 RepID=A0A814LTG3_9BILA|nr:unnamed protein product [Adineta steineri]CAF1068443.1 unnamed protein product [Adineta steineri]
MYQKTFYSRRVVERRNEKRKQRLRRLEKRSNYLEISSDSEEENQHIQETQCSTATTNNIFPTIIDDLSCYNNYHDDEHDNTHILNNIVDNFNDQSPPLYNDSKLSLKESMKLLMNLLISDINLDKQNILRLLKIIKCILPQPNTLPVTWKSIMKLFGRNNLFTTTFLCSLCHTKCDKTKFNTKICRNESCTRSKVVLKTHETTELVNLDVRTQLTSIINRNFNLILKNSDYFPKSDISSGAFYQTTISKLKCNTLTIVLHTDGAPLIRTTKQAIWPLFGSIVEICPPVREYQKNIILLGLWSSKSIWSGSIVLYPYDHNNLQLRSHSSFIAAAKEAQEKSTKKRIKSVTGVKGLSCLLEIMSYPQQILLDYMHLVCLGHVQTMIKRWIDLVDKSDVKTMDNMLFNIRVPHNIHVVYRESMSNVDRWKAKHSRLFVLNIGLPIGVANLPCLYASHWVIYCIAIKLLHAPELSSDIDFAEHLINFYCRTISKVYDQSLEYYSLHAHLHFPAQVRLHGGLSFCSAFTFESCIRYIKKKVHGTKNLASQIAYWYDMENMVNDTKFEIPSCNGISVIDFKSEQLVEYHQIIINLILLNDQHLKEIIFYKRYKHHFITYHTILYDKSFKCCSYIVSYDNKNNDIICYGRIIVFYEYDNIYFAFIQKYNISKKKISDFVELPIEVIERLNQLYPLMELSNDYDIISVGTFRHKCISIPFQDVFCSMSEIESAAERLDKEMNTDLESDCEAVVKNSKNNKQQQRQNLSSQTNLSRTTTQIDNSSTTKTNHTQKKNDHSATQTRIQSLASTDLYMPSTIYKTPPPINTSVHNKRVQETSIERSTSSTGGILRSVDNVARSTKNVRPAERMLTFDDDFGEGDSDDEQSVESVLDLDSLLPSTSATNDRNNIRIPKRSLPKTSKRTSHEKTAKRLCTKSSASTTNDSGNNEAIMLLKTLMLSVADLNKDMYQASKDIKNLLVSVDKVDKKINILYENQKKMQRALSKKKINVALNGDQFGDENIIVDDSPFKSTLTYVNSEGVSVDLLQLYGAQTHMGRYVALVMDKLFTFEEITTITKDELVNDERYLIIKEAVRSRFKLNHEMLQSEWSTLHESILQKRRNELKKKKSSAGNVTVQPAPQVVLQNSFDDFIGSFAI